MVRRVIVVLILLIAGSVGIGYSVRASDDDGRLITLYDRGEKSVFLTHKKTLGDALKEKHIELDTRDTVEPSLDEELVAPDYHVNIYRSRPVVVIDGQVRVKAVSPYQTAQHIAEDAGITVYDEDITTLKPSTDFVGDGAGLQLTITRATPLTLDLYGKKTKIRTQGKTVGEMLDEKGIKLGPRDRVSVAVTKPINSGMSVRVWREGKQTITVDETILYAVHQIFDADREVGYRKGQTPGEKGIQAVTYEVEIKDGKELSRQEIARIKTKSPKKEVVIVGIKTNPQSLTKAKGAQYFTDSKGVTHRETYYDLDMSRVMQACGQGGYYTVRVDGVKVDRDGYVIIAANYGRYPRCSIVETSVGPGKVYDTGGFAAVHPDGFDLATDWSRADGI
jgi:uncharacterized protein YabE (DUF348 family)